MLGVLPVEPPKATFEPGYPIKADDLNDNFKQLAYAIKDVGCAQENIQNDLGNYWDKSADDTVYEDKPWVTDDEHVATTQAIEERYWNKLKDVDSTYTDSNRMHHATCRDDYVPTTSAVENRLMDFVLEDDFEVIIGDINIHLDGIDTLLEGFLKLDGSTPMEGDLNMANNRVTNVPDPQDDLDAANWKSVKEIASSGGGGGGGTGNIEVVAPLVASKNELLQKTTFTFVISTIERQI